MGTNILENWSRLDFVWDLGQRKMSKFGFFWPSGNFGEQSQVSPL
jgi:hypothetical protein